MSLRKYWPITDNDVYVRIFDEILTELDLSLFPADLVASYRALGPESRHLVTRMYLRTAKWIRLEDFEKYMSIETLEAKVLPELIASGWIEDRPRLPSLISEVATQKELQEVAREVGIKAPAQSKRNQLAETLLELSAQQAFFGANRIAAKIARLLPIACYFLPAQKRQFLHRLELMFLYPVGPDAALDVVFLAHMKKHAFYPYAYTPQREAPCFESVEALEAYSRARELCDPLEKALASTAASLARHLIGDDNLSSIETQMQAAHNNEFKQAAYVLGRGVFNVSQLLMKAHMFGEEYQWIQKYLAQTAHRGKRALALIRKLLLELRFHEETGTKGETSWLVGAFNTYYDALSEVSPIERLDLDRKTARLIATVRKTGLKSALAFVQPRQRDMLAEIPVIVVVAEPVKIEGAPNGPGTRLVYADGFDVEQTALRHYAEYEGGHYENSMMLTIFWLAVWDLLFSDSADFRCKYQSHPANLQAVINRHLSEMEARFEPSVLSTTVTDSLSQLKDLGEPWPQVGSISWYISEASILGVITGLGASAKPILMRIATDYRRHGSGFPDLTLWNPKTQTTKFVEVKSENDTVSDNQQLWMEFLLSVGADVEVCKVVPQEPAKRRRK